MNKSWRKKLNESLPLVLTLLTLVFIIVQVYIAIKLNPPVIHLKVSSQLSWKVFLSWVVLKEIIFFLCAKLILYVIVITTITVIANVIKTAFSLTDKSRMYIGIITWFVFVSLVVVSNNLYFPHSKFAFIDNTPIKMALLKYFLYAQLVIIAILLITFIVSVKYYFSRFVSKRYKVSGVTALIAMTIIIIWSDVKPMSHDMLTDKPNVIIIGIDSLRVDKVKRFGASKTYVPAIDEFMQKATVFGNAYTPLARTFPAWVSILTGRYPQENGATLNLLPLEKIDRKHSLAFTLNNYGYQTIFAIDERRFSNLDNSFGFDEVIGPKVGFMDFILGSVNDFPLSNMVINTRLGKLLFPYNYANRASAVTYQPQTFNKLLARDLGDVRKRPVFLAVHLCLPHWPFYWAADKVGATEKLVSLSQIDRYDAYHRSLARGDKQFKAIMEVLKAQHLLDNAIVILLSDHGESIGVKGDRITMSENYIKGTPRDVNLEPLTFRELAFGHGSDIVTMNAYKVVLAIRKYGSKENIPNDIDIPVSLIDIRPTILELLRHSPEQSTGISLANYLYNEPSESQMDRPIFLESGFTLPALDHMENSVRDLIRQGVDYYQVDKVSGRLLMRQEKQKELMAKKQRGVIYQNWLLAIIPHYKESRVVLVNLNSGKWTDNLRSQFAQQAPLTIMFAELKKMYGDEIDWNIKGSL